MATAWILNLPFRPATCRVGLAVMDGGSMIHKVSGLATYITAYGNPLANRRAWRRVELLIPVRMLDDPTEHAGELSKKTIDIRQAAARW